MTETDKTGTAFPHVITDGGAGLFLLGGIARFPLFYREELGRIRGNDLIFGITRDDLYRDVLKPSEEESLAHAGFKQEIFLFIGEIESLLKHVDRRRRLLQQQLKRGVREDGSAVRTL